MQGFPEGDYKPGLVVTRDQMAVYIARTIAEPVGEAGLADYVPPDTPTFLDVPNTGFGEDGTEPHWAYRYVEYVFAQGVVQGFPEGDYKPDLVATRDQMAVYIARAFGLSI